MKNLKIAVILSTALLIISCGGPPEKNPLLEKAKNEYQKAEKDTVIVSKAPVALKEAEEELDKGKTSWKEEKNKKIIEHHAYIARQKVKIARQTALLNAAQDKVEKAESRRQKVMIKARKAEARAAEKRANQALSKAEKKKREAKEAQKRAEKLSEKVNELEAQQTERGLVLTLGDVLFDFGKADLKQGGMRAVSELTSFLNDYPKRKVLIEGYTDSVGSSSYNKKLSHDRANAVKQALMDNNISNSRIRIRGYGEQYPVATNDTKAGRQRNRRVEVVISDKDGTIKERDQQ